MGERFLVTGAQGCLGAWVVKHLMARDMDVVAGDLTIDPVRPRLIMGEDAIAKVDWQRLDVTEAEAVMAMVQDKGITRIVHLAGLQIPFCKADPARGAAVNVSGTVHVFEAARAAGVQGLAYASSLAVIGREEDYDMRPVPDDAIPRPYTLYGAYKVANEQTARVYAEDWGVGSVGLRPCVVYGVGRDQGMSSDLAKALLAAVAGQAFHIRLGGRIPVEHASDVAEMFIGSAMAGGRAARVFNMRNDVVTVPQYIEAVRRIVPGAEITHAEGVDFPHPADLDDAGLRGLLGTVPHTPLDQALARDAEMFRTLLAEDRIDLTQLTV
ncbi:MAG: NAD(P)-dependent oxidoreductase [Silicimonas sp.]|nr:NAD(P)-dependent oxidoreductase [Silicimonas sp.]